MITPNGTVSLKKSSSDSLIKNQIGLREALFLLGLGLASVLIHVSTRRMMQIPGHQGIGWIGLLMLARRNSDFRWASLVSSIGAATVSAAPMWSFHDPFRFITMPLAAVTIDLLFCGTENFRNNAYFLSAAGGLAHMTKPVFRVGLASVRGWPYGSLRWGLAYPSATHFLFGLLGSLAAIAISAIVNPRKIAGQ
ncbi:MAG: hypothetical protein RJA81_1273 [Planctomycetota bacterium]